MLYLQLSGVNSRRSCATACISSWLQRGADPSRLHQRAQHSMYVLMISRPRPDDQYCFRDLLPPVPDLAVLYQAGLRICVAQSLQCHQMTSPASSRACITPCRPRARSHRRSSPRFSSCVTSRNSSRTSYSSHAYSPSTYHTRPAAPSSRACSAPRPPSSSRAR
jgi:hypothetical protein